VCKYGPKISMCGIIGIKNKIDGKMFLKLIFNTYK